MPSVRQSSARLAAAGESRHRACQRRRGGRQTQPRRVLALCRRELDRQHDGGLSSPDMTFIGHVATRIICEVYDITSKPPGTIELSRSNLLCGPLAFGGVRSIDGRQARFGEIASGDFVARRQPYVLMRCDVFEGFARYLWRMAARSRTMQRERHHASRLRTVFVELIELINDRTIEVIADRLFEYEQIDVVQFDRVRQRDHSRHN